MSSTTIGSSLKEAREKRGFSLQEIQNQLKIHAAILEKLESDDFQSLPAPVYAKAFLQRYASFLGLNTQEILSQFDSIKPQTQGVNVNVGSAAKQRITV